MNTRHAGYCPYEIEELHSFGFKSDTEPTDFGEFHYHVRRHLDEPTATLLLHGVASDSRAWTPFLRAAGRSGVDLGNILMVDLPGYGESENLKDSLWIPEVGQLLIKICEQNGYRNIRLVGHSMGGFLALDMAGRFPDSITSVHVAAGSYLGILATIRRPIANIARRPTTALLWNAYWLISLTGELGSTAIRRLVAAGAEAVVLRPFVAHPKQLRSSVIQAVMDQLNPRGVVLTARNGKHYSAKDRWGRIDVPVVALVGSDDYLVTDSDLVELRKIVPHATTMSVADAGHLLPMERPYETLASLMLQAPETNQ